MKHIKSISLFESNNIDNVDEVIQNIKDIFLEFRDLGLEITAEKNKKITRVTKFGAWLLGAGAIPDIFTGIRSSRPKPYSLYADSIYHLIGYMKDSGFYITDFEISHLDGKFTLKSSIFKDGKPSFSEVGQDPISYCDLKFRNTLVKEIRINFKRN